MKKLSVILIALMLLSNVAYASDWHQDLHVVMHYLKKIEENTRKDPSYHYFKTIVNEKAIKEFEEINNEKQRT